LYKPEFGSFEQLVKRIGEYKSECPDGHVILSSETFCGATPKVLNILKEALSTYDEISIIGYYRRQDRYLASFWKMYVSMGQMDKTFEDWATECITENRYSLFYDRQISKFERLFGDDNLTICVYDDIDKTSFFRFFMKQCGVEDFEGMKEPVIRHNQYDLRPLPMELRTIATLCEDKYSTSNAEVARKYLQRDLLFTFND